MDEASEEQALYAHPPSLNRVEQIKIERGGKKSLVVVIHLTPVRAVGLHTLCSECLKA